MICLAGKLQEKEEHLQSQKQEVEEVWHRIDSLNADLKVPISPGHSDTTGIYIQKFLTETHDVGGLSADEKLDELIALKQDFEQ